MDGQPKPNILITRLSHIGDCLLTLPMVNAIKDQCPQARITWAVESPTQKLLALHPSVDEILMIPKGWAGKPRCWISLRRQLQQPQFDIAIDPQGITKSAGLGWLSGAKQRIGIRGRWGRELSTWLNNKLVETEATHIVPRSIELIQGMGLSVNANPPRFDLPVCPESQQQVVRWLDEVATDQDFDPQKIIVINPGGTWASKRWEMDRFGAVANYLKSHHDLTSVVVWAGDEEHQMATDIKRHADALGPSNACVVACPTSLRELAALSALGQFFIGGDTGPLHLANAVGTPCIGLYGTTRPEDSCAFGDQHIAIQAWYQDGSCRQRRNATNDAMRDISIEAVQQASDQMVSQIANSKLPKFDAVASKQQILQAG
ncbi:MAG: glycosyltransferase family 9 protein [Planctomycetota bacterium]